MKRYLDNAVAFKYYSANEQIWRNIDMEELDKQCMQHQCTDSWLYDDGLHQCASITIHGSTIVGDLDHQIRLYRHGQFLEQKLVAHRFKNEMLVLVGWQAI